MESGCKSRTSQVLLLVRSTIGLFSKKSQVMRTNRRKGQFNRPEARSLKIQPIHRLNRWSRTVVPEIKLCGNWLAKLGFEPEGRVTVHASTGLIVIRHEDEPDEV